MTISYSVVIALDRTDKDLPVLSGLAGLPPQERPAEIFACVGKNPSFQRNLGVEQCTSEVVYFLDDDSFVIPGTTRELLSHFEETRTAVAGGPNLLPPNASSFERTVDAVIASWLGSFSVRNRYTSKGSVKEATEKDLILCNMMVRRKVFLAEKGFRADLYPNEENEFLNRLLHSGYRLVYDPGGAIYRSRRKTLPAFCHQAFRYGKGRAQQMKIYPCLSDVVHLVPAFFLLYLLSFLVPFFVCLAPHSYLSFIQIFIWPIPLILFFLLAFGTGASAVSWNRHWTDLFKVPGLILLRHSFYGLGLMTGFFSKTLQRPKDVRIFSARFVKKKYSLFPYPSASESENK